MLAAPSVISPQGRDKRKIEETNNFSGVLVSRDDGLVFLYKAVAWIFFIQGGGLFLFTGTKTYKGTVPDCFSKGLL